MVPCAWVSSQGTLVREGRHPNRQGLCWVTAFVIPWLRGRYYSAFLKTGNKLRDLHISEILQPKLDYQEGLWPISLRDALLLYKISLDLGTWRVPSPAILNIFLVICLDSSTDCLDLSITHYLNASKFVWTLSNWARLVFRTLGLGMCGARFSPLGVCIMNGICSAVWTLSRVPLERLRLQEKAKSTDWSPSGKGHGELEVDV